ncbi:MAG: hypothetical protein JST16_03530 [Bdellovibrionales bacterium]|nr:hypothetical protein [Bdellovibrionales bacterium]
MLFFLVFLSRISFATPQVVRVDGSIFDASGAPLSTNKDIQIKAYDAVSGGTPLWTSNVSTAVVNVGRFTINMDAASGSSPSLVTQIGLRTSGQGIYFQIEVDSGAANGSMESAQVVLPRIRARGTMFALAAAQADSLKGVTATASEMNFLSGVTANLSSLATALVGVTATAAELNSLAGVTANLGAKVNRFTAAEAGYLSGATASVQSQIQTLRGLVGAQNVRLYAVSGAPYDGADHTALTTLYVGPYNGNVITLGTSGPQTFSEVSFSVPSTSSTMYDVYATSSGLTGITVSTLAWSNTSTPPTRNLVNGYLVKSDDSTKLLVGVFMTSSTTGQTTDSAPSRLVQSYFNRLPVNLSASGTSANTTPGQGRTEFVVAVQDQQVRASYAGVITSGTNGSSSVGIDIDSTSTSFTTSGTTIVVASGSTSVASAFSADYWGVPAPGYHYIQNRNLGTNAPSSGRQVGQWMR